MTGISGFNWDVAVEEKLQYCLSGNRCFVVGELMFFQVPGDPNCKGGMLDWLCQCVLRVLTFLSHFLSDKADDQCVGSKILRRHSWISDDECQIFWRSPDFSSITTNRLSINYQENKWKVKGKKNKKWISCWKLKVVLAPCVFIMKT